MRQLHPKTKLLYLTGLLLLLCFNLQAKDYKIIGADIQYKYIGNYSYEIKLNIYTDCTGDPLDTVRIMINSPYKNIKAVLAKITDKGDVTMTGCHCPNQCTDSNSTAMGIRKWEAVADVKINTDSSCEYLFSWQAPNRINASNGKRGQAFYIEAYMNACNYPEVGSPEFTNKPFFFMPRNGCSTKYNPIRDSIINNQLVTYKYRLVEPKQGFGGWNWDFYYYNSGFSFDKPLTYRGYPNVYPDTACMGFFFDSTTGSFHTTPVKDESFPVAIRVYKFVNGKPVSQTMRDITYFSIDVPGDRPPLISGIDGTSRETDTFYIGKQSCFTIATFDPDKNDSVKFDKYEFLDTSASFNFQTGKKWPKGTFCWTPPAGSASDSPYILRVTVHDDLEILEDTQWPRYTTKEYAIYVLEPTGIAPVSAALNVSIYPVPASGELKVTGFTERPLSLYAADITGRLIPLSLMNDGNTILVNTSVLSNGIYTLMLRGKENTARGRFVIDR